MAGEVAFWANLRDEAAQRMHWHLTRAANMTLMDGFAPLSNFDREMEELERARKECAAAHRQVLSAQPDGGEKQHHGD